MRIVLAPVGSRGDVQPLVALGMRLQHRGHHVVVAAPSNFRDFVSEAGLEYQPGVGDYRTFMESLRTEPFLKVLARQVQEQFEFLLDASRQADAIVGCQLQLAGPSVAEFRRVPYFAVHLAPVFIRSDEHPPVTIQTQTMNHARNFAAWERRARQWNKELLPPINTQRCKLGLPDIADAQDHVLHSGHLLLCCEQTLAPVPRFSHARVSVTGAWYDASGSLDEEIIRFCDCGTKPIFIGFGSMMFRPASELLPMFVDAATATGVRAVFGLGWLTNKSIRVPSHCLLVGSVPYHLLFQRVAAAVHHGGAGTVATAALAGIPQGIVPHFADQFYWGHQLYQAGLAARPVSIKKLNTTRLVEIIRELQHQHLIEEARRVGNLIDVNLGVTKAVKIIEKECSVG